MEQFIHAARQHGPWNKRLLRLSEIDRGGSADDVTHWFPPTFLVSGVLSPAILSEES